MKNLNLKLCAYTRGKMKKENCKHPALWMNGNKKRGNGSLPSFKCKTCEKQLNIPNPIYKNYSYRLANLLRHFRFTVKEIAEITGFGIRSVNSMLDQNLIQNLSFLPKPKSRPKFQMESFFKPPEFYKKLIPRGELRSISFHLDPENLKAPGLINLDFFDEFLQVLIGTLYTDNYFSWNKLDMAMKGFPENEVNPITPLIYIDDGMEEYHKFTRKLAKVGCHYHFTSQWYYNKENQSGIFTMQVITRSS